METVATEVADDPKRGDNKTDWIYKDTLFHIDSLLSKISRGNISTSAAKLSWRSTPWPLLIHLIKKRSAFEMRISAYLYDFPCTNLAFYVISKPVWSQVLDLDSEDRLTSTLQFNYCFSLLFLIHYVVQVFEITALKYNKWEQEKKHCRLVWFS